ncbi:MAG TPA: hypothetical protein DCL61_29060 [Cyanobacteria bacterium UBA12227]|nr:hypothetical protein [Cyanobacteria bacterium UBA12227]HAX86240.1 hypothetical protein [Cyanobacteria bacterium UBA11370]HBY81366.1 hypothetical protein [Cyanobacteria bacterium UBA11148]
MSLLSIDEVKTLVEQPKGWCVSIYMPIYRVGAEIQQNPVRFKNLMREAEDKLVENGLSNREALELLQPAKDKIDSDDNFWQQPNDGLAIFLADGVFHYYRLPLSFDELVVVTDHFHLKPLLPLLTEDGRFYILALSQQDIRLFECTRYSVSEVELPDVPKSIDEALLYDETAKDGQFRISTSKGGTNNPFQHAGSFHGQGSPDQDKHQEEILQFFHTVNDGLQKYLRAKRAPLVLAGVEYLFPIYREANTYPNLIDEGITGNPENAKPEELQAQAWEIVEPLFLKSQQEAIDHYRELAQTGRSSSNIKEAVSAAYYGRIEELFVAVGVQQWGSFNPDTNTIDLHAEAEPGDEDLLNSAAIQTILNGGTVYAVEPDQVPDEAPLAAVFRY